MELQRGSFPVAPNQTNTTTAQEPLKPKDNRNRKKGLASAADNEANGADCVPAFARPAAMLDRGLRCPGRPAITARLYTWTQFSELYRENDWGLCATRGDMGRFSPSPKVAQLQTVHKCVKRATVNDTICCTQ